MDIRKLAMYADVLFRTSQLAVERNFFIQPMNSHRQEWWVLANKQVIDVSQTHGQTAVEILENRGSKVPIRPGDIPDFSEAMNIMFKEGAARVHKHGNEIVISFEKLTSNIIDGVTDLLMSKNVPLENPIKLQSGGIGNFTDIYVSFLDLLQSGNSPRNLEKIYKERSWGGSKLAMYIDALFRYAQDNINTPNVTIQPGRKEADCALEILKLWQPNFFQGVREIVIGPSADYGHVESGPNKDPAVIYLNADRIVSESGGQQGGQAAALATAKVIAHEKGHVASYNNQQGFVGGETPAENQEQEFENWLTSGGMKRVEVLPSFQALGH